MNENTIVAKDEAGLRLDRWFKRRFPGLGHGPLEKLLRTGQVRVDGKRARAGDRLVPGQSIRVPPQARNKADGPKLPAATSLKPSEKKFVQRLVIYEDSSVIALNKPSGLATQGGSGVQQHIDGLLEALQGRRRQRPRLVHRLDRDTSGVLVVARTQPAAAALSESLRSRDARKIYWALTQGVPKPPTGTIKLVLAKQTGFGKSGRDERMSVAKRGDEGAKSATTHYTVIGRAAGRYAWVALRPITGRTHQLRVHLAAIGTPIVGDFKYGGANAKGMGELEDRLHLHAHSIDIAHPEGGRLKVTAPLPDHMEKAWALFGFDSAADADPFEEKKRPDGLPDALRAKRRKKKVEKRL